MGNNGSGSWDNELFKREFGGYHAIVMVLVRVRYDALHHRVPLMLALANPASSEA